MNRRQFCNRALGIGAGLGLTLPSFAQLNPNTENSTEEKIDFLSAEVRNATEKGLAYLARTQLRDGGFGDSFNYSGNLAITALSGMAFMAGGHVPNRGAYGDNVLRAMNYILSKESTKIPGFLHYDAGRGDRAPMYSHGFATLFLAELYGMVPDKILQRKLKGTIERAVQVIISSQNSEGGWRYEPQKTLADSSATICQIMALRSAKNAGFYVPAEVAAKTIKYIRSCQTSDGGFSYFAGNGGSLFPRSAAGVVALNCAGVYSGPENDRGLAYLLRFKPGKETDFQLRGGGLEGQYYYGQYYAAQAMWTAGPKYWNVWFPAIRDDLLKPTRHRNDGAWSDPAVGSHYATAMACIIFQIPNNYLPILQK